MYDVFAVYARPSEPAAFDAHYVDVHVPKVMAMPNLLDFAWGKVAEGGENGPYLIARMTFANAEAAAEAMSSDVGRVAVADLDSFAMAGVVVHNVPRETAPSARP